MTDFFDRLLARGLGQAPLVRPRVASRFEPPLGLAQPDLSPSEELLAAAPLEPPAPSEQLPRPAVPSTTSDTPSEPVSESHSPGERHLLPPIEAGEPEHAPGLAAGREPTADREGLRPAEPSLHERTPAEPETAVARLAPRVEPPLRTAAPRSIFEAVGGLDGPDEPGEGPEQRLVGRDARAPRLAGRDVRASGLAGRDARAPGSPLPPREPAAERSPAATPDYSAGRPSVEPVPGLDAALSRLGLENGSGSEPTIRVTIGRIEVRAVAPPEPQKPVPAAPAAPKLSLDEYLRTRPGERP